MPSRKKHLSIVVLFSTATITFAWAAADCIVDSTAKCCDRATLPAPNTCTDGSKCPVFPQMNPTIPLCVTMHSDGWKTQVVQQDDQKCTFLRQDCVPNGMGGYYCAPHAMPDPAVPCTPTKLDPMETCTTH